MGSTEFLKFVGSCKRFGLTDDGKGTDGGRKEEHPHEEAIEHDRDVLPLRHDVFLRVLILLLLNDVLQVRHDVVGHRFEPLGDHGRFLRRFLLRVVHDGDPVLMAEEGVLVDAGVGLVLRYLVLVIVVPHVDEEASHAHDSG